MKSAIPSSTRDDRQFPPRGILDQLPLFDIDFQGIGFDTIDVFADPLEIDIKERKLIKDTCREVGLPVISVCCCALGIADFNGPVRRFHIERAKKHLELVYELEAKNLLLVLGEYIWQQEVIAPRDQWKWAVEAASELGDYAAGLGIEIAIELEPFQLSIVNTLAKMVSFLDDLHHPAVRANLDISHLALAHTPAEDSPTCKGALPTFTSPIATERSMAICPRAGEW